MIIRKVKVTEYEYQAPINYVAGATEPDIQFQLTDYEIPSGATGRVYVERSDGTFEYTVATISGNNVTVAPTSSMFSVKGPGAIQVTLYVGNEVVKNFAVPVYVHADLADDSAEAGSDVTGVFRAAEEEALADFQEQAEQIVEEVIESIPADYTELTDEVDELNERIDDRISGVNFSANGNLYNTQALVENKYIDPNSGKIVRTTYTGFAYSKTYINVTSGETICSNTRMFIAYYDSNLNIVSALQMDSTKKTVVPSGAVYARFSASAPDQYAVVVQRGESLNSDKNDYTFSLDGLNINPFSLGAQQYKSLMNFEPSDNLYNVYAIVKQKYIDPSSGKIISTSNDTWACSTTYIPVSSGDVLTATDRMIIAYYDDEYNVISALQMDATKQTTVPANASFARFSVSADDHSAVKVVKGTSIDSSVGTYSFRLKGLSVGEGVIVVDANGDGDYTSFTEAIYENVDDGRDVIVKAGTYNIVSEYIALFGQSVVDNLADSTGGMNNFQYGVRIHDRKVTFESGSHLVCDWTGHTVNGTHRFCPLRVEPNAHIVGLDLDCTATFYGIHDDYGTADNSPFTIKYENCRVIGHNLYNANCIGGGAHKYSRHILHNCYFKNNVSSSDMVLSADVRYHNTNTADAEPELYVSNCYFSNNMNVTYYGTQTTKFRAYVNNCFAPHGIIKRAESASMTTDNVELYTWNNHTN